MEKIGFFAVQKGNDIHIIYDATKCLLDAALWCPSFYLPEIDSVLQHAYSYTWFGDIDIWEMLLNYMLDD